MLAAIARRLAESGRIRGDALFGPTSVARVASAFGLAAATYWTLSALGDVLVDDLSIKMVFLFVWVMALASVSIAFNVHLLSRLGLLILAASVGHLAFVLWWAYDFSGVGFESTVGQAMLGPYVFSYLIHLLSLVAITRWALQPLARPSAPRTIAEIADARRERANSYRQSGAFALSLILVALLGGASVFLAADSIATNELDARLSDALDKQLSIVAEEERLNAVLLRVAAVAEQPDPHELVYENILELRQVFERQLERAAGRSDVSIAEALSKRKADVQRILDEVNERQATDSDWRVIASSLSTRVGSVLLIVFFVQILASIYRYAVQMAAGYDASADVLSVADKPSDTTRLQELLREPSVRFGAVPQSPQQHLADVATRISERGRSQ